MAWFREVSIGNGDLGIHAHSVTLVTENNARLNSGDGIELWLNVCGASTTGC